MPQENVKRRPLTVATSTLLRAPVVGDAQQVLGRVDDVARDAEQLAEHVRRAAGQAGQRRVGPDQAVGGLVERAVAAERDDDVVALVRGLARQVGRVARPLVSTASTS